jgi:hypothetical protein
MTKRRSMIKTKKLGPKFTVSKTTGKVKVAGRPKLGAPKPKRY